MARVIISILFLASTTSAALICSNGGTGPCVMGACLTAGETCDTAQVNCCPISQLIDDAVVDTTTAAAVDPTSSTVAADTTTASSVTTTASTTSAACADLVNPSTGVSDCAARASLCNDSTYYDLMTVQCPRTCNRCSSVSTTASTGTCVDAVNPRTGTSDCSLRANLCTDSNYIALMRVQCPRTCGFCGSSTVAGASTTATTTCVDRTAANGQSDCASRAYLCRNAAYATLMREQCPRTCGFC